MEDEWELRKVRKRQGAQRSRSSGTPGAERDLWRDKETGSLLGPTESIPVDEDELRSIYGGGTTGRAPSEAKDEPGGLSPAQEIMVEFFSEQVDKLLDEYVIPALKERGLPALRKKWGDWSRRHRRGKQVVEPDTDATDREANLQLTDAVSSRDLQPTLEQGRVPMTQEQYDELCATEQSLEEGLRKARMLRSRALIVEGPATMEVGRVRTLPESKVEQLNASPTVPGAEILRDAQETDEVTPT